MSSASVPLRPLVVVPLALASWSETGNTLEVVSSPCAGGTGFATRAPLHSGSGLACSISPHVASGGQSHR